MKIDVQAELSALPPVMLLDNAVSDAAPVVSRTIGAAVGKLARQQFQANQQVEHMLEQLRGQLDQMAQISDERRREVERLRDDAQAARLRILDALDSLDDLRVIAKQREDSFWTGRVERLAARFADALAAIGVTELPAAGSTFDDQMHEVLETADAGSHTPPNTIVEVIRRGFRHDGAVLRRAQVITSR